MFGRLFIFKTSIYVRKSEKGVGMVTNYGG